MSSAATITVSHLGTSTIGYKLGKSSIPLVTSMEFWHATYSQNYTGDDGRARGRVSSINVRDRDGLHGRLDAIHCPVLRMHGTEDPVYSIANAEDEQSRFVNSPNAELKVVDGGRHFLSASDPDAVNTAVAESIDRWM